MKSGLMKVITESKFVRNVLTLSTGTIVAQVFAIISAPILSRLFAPEDFGLLAIYGSCVSVLAIIATGRYELAITIPKSDIDAANLVLFTLKLTILISILVGVVCSVWGDDIANKFGYASVIPWLYLLPLSIMAVCTFHVFQFWLNRCGNYKYMSINRVKNELLRILANILLGLGKISGGLIIGGFISQATNTALVSRKCLANDAVIFAKTTTREQNLLAIKYINHPLHIAPSHLIGVVATQIPIFMIGSIYSLETLGLFGMAFRMVTLPVQLISNAVGDVFRQEASRRNNAGERIDKLFIITIKKLAKFALIPTIIIYLSAPTLFSVIFGSKWTLAGEYARILIVMAFFQFIFTPVDKIALIKGKTMYILVWHVLRLVGLLIVFFIAKFYLLNIEMCILLFVAVNLVLYFIDIVVEFQFAKEL
jgi:O-antigen/teichoic acid export membrane protein